MSAKLPLSTRTRLGLKPSIMSIMIRGSSCGCFTPRASFSEKTISKFSLLLCLDGRIIWTLFTCFSCDLLRDLNDPPAVGPPLIILISPMASLGDLLDDLRSWVFHLILLMPLALLDLVCPSSQIFVTFLFGLILLSILSDPYNLLCNGHDLCGNNNTSSCRKY